jgi:hypothetical protein
MKTTDPLYMRQQDAYFEIPEVESGSYTMDDHTILISSQIYLFYFNFVYFFKFSYINATF